jgi:hypothetical protein
VRWLIFVANKFYWLLDDKAWVVYEVMTIAQFLMKGAKGEVFHCRDHGRTTQSKLTD